MKLTAPKYVTFSTAFIAYCAMFSSVNVFATESWTSFAPPAPYSESEKDIDRNWRTGQRFNVSRELRYAPKQEVEEFERKARDFRSKPKRVSVNPWKSNGSFKNSSSFSTNKRPWGNVPEKKRERHIRPLPDMSTGHRISPDNGLNHSPLIPIGGLGGPLMAPGGYVGGYYPGSIYSSTLRRPFGYGRQLPGLYPFSGPGGLFGRW